VWVLTQDEKLKKTVAVALNEGTREVASAITVDVEPNSALRFRLRAAGSEMVLFDNDTGTLMVLDLDSGAVRQSFAIGKRKEIDVGERVAFTWSYYVDRDPIVEAWCIDSGTKLARFDVSGFSFAVNRTRKLAISGDDNGTAHVWKLDEKMFKC
jgi:hypothetical protein